MVLLLSYKDVPPWPPGFVLLCFGVRLLCSLGWLVQVNFERGPPTSTSQVLEFQTCATTPSAFHTWDVGQKYSSKYFSIGPSLHLPTITA